MVGAAWAAVLGGCAVGPDYVRPATTMPAHWTGLSTTTQPASTTQPSHATTRPAAITTWWKVFNEPKLDSLIERAARSNLDLRLAEARVREARAQRGVVAADFWPQANVTGSYAYRGTSETATEQASVKSGGGLARLGLPGVTIKPGAANAAGGFDPPTITINPSSAGAAAAAAAMPAVERDQNLFQAGFDASWEIDVFGRIRRSVEAAEAGIQATEEARRDVLVTLFAEVARTYVQLRTLQRRLAIARENIASQQETLVLTQSRLRAGLTSELDVAQASAQLASTQSQVPTLESAIKQAIYQLGILLGQPPGALLAELESEGPVPAVPPEVPIGLPSELLRRRPDVRQAERLLAAATAQIGVATADLFPRFSLTGSFGTQTADMQYFLDNRSLLWSVGPSVRWPIFDGWRIRSNIQVQNARQEQALAAYEKAVLVALQDVENALVVYAAEQQRYRSLAEAVASNQRSFELSSELYRRGLAPFLNVLEAQRALYLSQDAMVQSESLVVGNLIALYKALGGGWDVEDAALDPQANSAGADSGGDERGIMDAEG